MTSATDPAAPVEAEAPFDAALPADATTSRRAGRRRLPRPTPADGAWILIAAGCVLIVALHLLRTDVNPALHYISEYGNESWSWMLTLALLATAIGLVGLGSMIATVARSTRAARLLAVSGGLLVLAAITSTDRHGGVVEQATLSGKVHGVMAILAFCTLVGAMLMLSLGPGERRSLLGRAGVWVLPAAVTAVGAVVLAFVAVPDAHGLRQRLFLAIVFGWLLATALELRKGRP